MKWLKSNFEVLSESELLEVIFARGFKGRYAAVTLMIGYRDNYDLAYPVLRAHSIPAIFFVCSGLLNSRRLGWWDLISYFVKKSKESKISLLGEVIPLGEQKMEAITKLTDWMKQRPCAATANLMEALSAACGVAFPGR